MVGWSAIVRLVTTVKLVPPFVLRPMTHWVKDELNEPTNRLPKLSYVHVGSPPRLGRPSAPPVSRPVQLVPPFAVTAAKLTEPVVMLLDQANMLCGLVGLMAMAVSAW